MSNEKKQITPELFWASQPPMKSIPDAIREYHELKINENLTTNGRSGMYGEMPKIKIGKYTISDMSDEQDCSTVWIENTEISEAGQFSKGTLLGLIDNFYKEYF